MGKFDQKHFTIWIAFTQQTRLEIFDLSICGRKFELCLVKRDVDIDGYVFLAAACTHDMGAYIDWVAILVAING